jgi:hypothetical protein
VNPDGGTDAGNAVADEAVSTEKDSPTGTAGTHPSNGFTPFEESESSARALER